MQIKHLKKNYVKFVEHLTSDEPCALRNGNYSAILSFLADRVRSDCMHV